MEKEMKEKPVRGHITEVDADCSAREQKKYLKLDIACGNSKKEGFIGIDIAEETQCDWICNLNYYPWQYKEIVKRYEGGCQYKELYRIEDSSVGEIHCSHYIEHVKDLRKFAQEIYRILIPGGRVTFIAPYYSSIRAMQDPTHVNFISEATFLYWNKTWIEANKLSHYNMNCDFAVMNHRYIYNPEWASKSSAAKEFARKHYINVVADIEITLQAVK